MRPCNSAAFRFTASDHPARDTIVARLPRLLERERRSISAPSRNCLFNLHCHATRRPKSFYFWERYANSYGITLITEYSMTADQSGNGAGAGGAEPKIFYSCSVYQGPFLRESQRAADAGTAADAPNLSVQINVNARQLAANDYEVSLMLEGGASQGAETMFKFELNYAGVFRIENFPSEQVQPMVMIEAPRMLFPFARQIIAEAVRGGSYPPLYLDPIDFHALYLQRLAAAGGQQQQRTA